jgi:hypothetical protein
MWSENKDIIPAVEFPMSFDSKIPIQSEIISP